MDAIEPYFILPEVRDPNHWWGGHMYVDRGKRYVYSFLAFVQEAVWYNTNLMNPDEVRTYDDLLRPKWSDKIGYSDPRAGGAGQGNWTFLWKTRGEDFLRRLVQQKLVIMREERPLAEYLVKGNVAITIGLDIDNFGPFVKAGLPVRPLPPLKDESTQSRGPEIWRSSKILHKLSRKLDKLSTAMTGCGLAQHLPGAGVEGGIQREGAVTKVFKAMALRTSRRKWQQGIFSIQGLNGRFLIDREHRRMLRRIDVQPDNVGCLSLKLRVVAGQVSLQPIRFEPVFGPYPRNTHVRDIPEFGRQFSLAPVSRTVRGLFLNRPPKNACLSTLAILMRRTSPIAREQPRYALGQKATLPARNEIGVAVEFTAYHIKPLAGFNQQN